MAMDKKLKVLVYALEVVMLIVAALLVLRGALGAFKLTFGATGLLIPLDIIVGSLTLLLTILSNELFNKYIFE